MVQVNVHVGGRFKDHAKWVVQDFPGFSVVRMSMDGADVSIFVDDRAQAQAVADALSIAFPKSESATIKAAPDVAVVHPVIAMADDSCPHAEPGP